MDSIKELPSLPMLELLTMAFCRKGLKKVSSESSLKSPDNLVGQRTELNLQQKLDTWTNRLAPGIRIKIQTA